MNHDVNGNRKLFGKKGSNGNGAKVENSSRIKLYLIWPLRVVLCLKNWGSAVIVLLYKDKGERTECKNYRGISLVSMAGKISMGIFVECPHSEWVFN